jgi:hypothetical protein
MVGALDREPPIIETDQSLSDYGDSLIIPGDPKSTQKLLDQVGPIQVWRIVGMTNHIVVVNTHADCDDAHEEELARVTSRLGPTWRCFAVAYNPEEGWDCAHFEPVKDARPLT